jgi:hypothetical protein
VIIKGLFMESIFRSGLLAAAAMLSSCALAGDVLEGRVINHQDGTPIKDAFVIAQWMHYGSDGFGSRTTCRHVDVVKTNDVGHWRIPNGRWASDVSVRIFKPGLEEYIGKNTIRPEEEEEDLRLRRMIPFSGSIEKRAREYDGLGYLLACRNGNRETLGALYLAIDGEAVALGIRRQFMRSLIEIEQQEQAKKEREKR